MMVKKVYNAKIILTYSGESGQEENLEPLVVLATEMFLNSIGVIDVYKDFGEELKDIERSFARKVGLRVHIEG
jgi:hypothetical protein